MFAFLFWLFVAGIVPKLLVLAVSPIVLMWLDYERAKLDEAERAFRARDEYNRFLNKEIDRRIRELDKRIP